MARGGTHRQLGNLVCYVIKRKYGRTPKYKRATFGVTKSTIVNFIEKLFNNSYRLEVMRNEFNYNYEEIKKLHEMAEDKQKFFRGQMGRILNRYNNNGLYGKGTSNNGEVIYGLSPNIEKKFLNHEFVGNREMLGALLS